jgi:hypothetical protein
MGSRPGILWISFMRPPRLTNGADRWSFCITLICLEAGTKVVNTPALQLYGNEILLIGFDD